MGGFAGAPGTPTGLALRVAQCVFAAGSVAFIATTPRFTAITAFTAFCYLAASMDLQAIWSLGLALLDAYALVKKKDICFPVLVSLFVVGDCRHPKLPEIPAIGCLSFLELDNGLHFFSNYVVAPGCWLEASSVVLYSLPLKHPLVWYRAV
ncbi:hypothetical protein Ancab_013154 [Ancistrocladus abbreviatus]